MQITVRKEKLFLILLQYLQIVVLSYFLSRHERYLQVVFTSLLDISDELALGMWFVLKCYSKESEKVAQYFTKLKLEVTCSCLGLRNCSPGNTLLFVKREIFETIILFNCFAHYAAFLWCALQKNKSTLLNSQEIFFYLNKHF